MTTDTHRFAYADGILTKWYQAGVHHKADIPVADSSYKRRVVSQTPRRTGNNVTTSNKFNNFAQNSYDFDDLERNILSN
jgi:DNA replication protein DnaD